MDSFKSSSKSGTDAQENPLAPSSSSNLHHNAEDPGSSSCQNESDDHLMPPPVAPPRNISLSLAQNFPFSTPFISPSKEGEVPMEFSPGIKRHMQKANFRDVPKSPGTPTTLFKSLTTKDSPDSKTVQQSDSSEMHPGQIFANPESPSSEFKAMLDEIDVQESSSGYNDDNFLRRQEKPNFRRSRSLDLRKRLFDLSNTPPNAFKSVYKRPAAQEEDGDQSYTKLAKRPKELKLFGIKETSTSPLVKEQKDSKDPQEKVSDQGEVLDHERIKVAVDALQSPDVIGDCSREHCLPVITGKHNDLKNISHETMAHLLNEGYKDKFQKLTVIDCRYPYEYEGGHIKGAVNIYTEDDIDLFLKKEVLEVTGNQEKTHILVFHCEFSSQRGPSLLRHLRKLDRKMNIHQYPQLTFPEIYVLHLGYKEFFHNHPHLCIPSAYIPMADESYIEDLKYFRAKAKSWTAGERSGSFKR
ncbi:M-phase inducer phosphatase [Elysia marginata]|uniref:M-phase inducer phosphatase n=1 Tax=Elysia marginata TaxID=1093978 RepID=A0AAV4EZF4_9GAST|nr:M-phase inducer phosphatase [Elysia marginata]